MRIPVVTHLMSNGLRRNFGDITCGPSLVPRSCVRRDFQSGPDMTATSRHRSDVQHLLDIKLHAFPLPKTEIILEPKQGHHFELEITLIRLGQIPIEISLLCGVNECFHLSDQGLDLVSGDSHTSCVTPHSTLSAPHRKIRLSTWYPQPMVLLPRPSEETTTPLPSLSSSPLPDSAVQQSKINVSYLFSTILSSFSNLSDHVLSISVRTLIRIRCSAKERVPSTDPGWTIFVLPLLCKVDPPLLHFDSQFVILPCIFVVQALLPHLKNIVSCFLCGTLHHFAGDIVFLPLFAGGSTSIAVVPKSVLVGEQRGRNNNLVNLRGFEESMQGMPLIKRPEHHEAILAITEVQRQSRREMNIVHVPTKDRRRLNDKSDPTTREYLEWLSEHWEQHFTKERGLPTSTSSSQWSSTSWWSSHEWSSTWKGWQKHSWQDDKWSDQR